jgi:hypothetical protein
VVPLTFDGLGGSGFCRLMIVDAVLITVDRVRGDRGDPGDPGAACLRKAQAEPVVVPKIGSRGRVSRWRQW